MEINEATCLCRFGGCGVLREGAHAESNYWSVTSRAEHLKTKPYTLTYADIYIGQRRHTWLQAHTWKHVLRWLTRVVRFMWAWWAGGCETVRFPALPSTACMPLHRKHIAHGKQLDLLSVSVRLSVVWLSVSHLHSLILTHTHIQYIHMLSLQYATSAPLRPPTHPGWRSEVSESSGW